MLFLMFMYMQGVLWSSEGGVMQLIHLHHQVGLLQQEIENQEQRNAFLRAEVVDLKSGLSAVEEIARTEMGLVKPNEIFFQLINN